MKRWIAPVLLLVALSAVGVSLGVWKLSAIQEANAASLAQPEPAESVSAAVALGREHRPAATAIGTVLALRSVTLRNELAGTVQQVRLTSGAIVEAGTVLVALDVTVEEAELRALEAQAELARTMLERLQRLRDANATTEVDLDRARAERAVALAQVARTTAIIARKTIRAPFDARVGLADLHPGQYLNEGTVLTTLQSLDDGLHVDFSVPQDIAAALRAGDRIDVLVNGDAAPTCARIAALDARVDSATRSTVVRARITRAPVGLLPGASVRVRVSVGAPIVAVAIPGSSLRKGPEGDHVFVLTENAAGETRAHLRVVAAGAMLGDEVLVHSGLSAGERIAASGSFKLRDGMSVVVTEPAATTARTVAGS